MLSIKRSVQVMELLADGGPLGVRAIAGRLDLPVGSVHRLLGEMANEDIVARNADGEWELAFRLLQITGIQLDRIELPAMVRPFAEKIAAQTQETVNLNILNGLVAVCIDKVRGNQRMHLDMPIGSSGALNCGGAGKVILSYMAPADQARVLAAPLPRYNANTIIEAEPLRAEVERIRARGYAIDAQEVVNGIYCVAVPILNAQGTSAGSISITGPGPKAPGPAILPLVDMLNEAAGHVSQRLGYRGHWPPMAADIRLRT